MLDRSPVVVRKMPRSTCRQEHDPIRCSAPGRATHVPGRPANDRRHVRPPQAPTLRGLGLVILASPSEDDPTRACISAAAWGAGPSRSDRLGDLGPDPKGLGPFGPLHSVGSRNDDQSEHPNRGPEPDLGRRLVAAASSAPLPPRGGAHAAEVAEKVDYNRDIRPILSDNCFACHGPDAEHAQGRPAARHARTRRSTTREGGAADRPRQARRERADLPRRDRRPDARRCRRRSRGKTLTAEQIDAAAALGRAGGDVGRALGVRCRRCRPELPAVDATPTGRATPIDRFILARLEAEGLEPVARGRQDDADPPRHPRPDRPAADARGGRRLPRRRARPTPTSELVDRLLASPRYGEHMARYWLDAARYGDTHGLHLDNYREMWPYRDWVIDAFNHNQPFDQFRHRAARRRPAARSRRSTSYRHRLQPLPRHDERGGLDRGRGLRPQRASTGSTRSAPSSSA